MIDSYTLEQCQKDKDILFLKIKNLEHAIHHLEALVSESQMDVDTLTFLRRKVAESMQDLEVLYLLRENH